MSGEMKYEEEGDGSYDAEENIYSANVIDKDENQDKKYSSRSKCDDEDDDSESRRYEFEGKLYDTYMEMVNAKRARNRNVLRRIMNERINEAQCRQPK